MDDEDYKVTSELYEEHDYESKLLKPTFSKESECFHDAKCNRMFSNLALNFTQSVVLINHKVCIIMLYFEWYKFIDVVSTFKFQTAPVEPTKFDADGDLEVQRRSEVLTQTVEIGNLKNNPQPVYIYILFI